MLTQGAWLVAHGKRGRDNVVRRGMNVFRDMMCNEVTAPGFDPNAALAMLVSPDATVREIADVRGTNPSCAGCHHAADPAGLVFETYSSDGRWQDRYADGRPVEPQIELPSLGAFERAPDFTPALAHDPSVRFCLVRRFTTFALGRDLGPPAEIAWSHDAYTDFREADGQLEELLVSIVRNPAFVERQR